MIDPQILLLAEEFLQKFGSNFKDRTSSDLTFHQNFESFLKASCHSNQYYDKNLCLTLLDAKFGALSLENQANIVLCMQNILNNKIFEGNSLKNYEVFESNFSIKHKKVMNKFFLNGSREYKYSLLDQFGLLLQERVGSVIDSRNAFAEANAQFLAAKKLHSDAEFAVVKFTFNVVSLIAEKNPDFAKNALNAVEAAFESENFHSLRAVYVVCLDYMSPEAQNIVETMYQYLEFDADLKFFELDKAFKKSIRAEQIIFLAFNQERHPGNLT
jgi:hypothetical protein